MKKTLIALALLASMSSQAEVLHHGLPLAPFALTDHEGKPFVPQDLRGVRTLLYFGFTSCPDVCPAALSVLKVAQSQLPGVKVVFVTIDPKDSPEQLAAYAQRFGMRAASGDVVKLLASLGSKWDGADLNTHPATVFGIDSRGRWAAYWRFPQDAQQIVNEMHQVK